MSTKSESRPLRIWLLMGLLAGACTIFLAGPDLAAAPGDQPGDQGRASVSRGSSSGSSGGSSGGRSAVSGSSGGSGGRATATRPGGGSGGSGRTTAHRSPSSPPRGGHFPRYSRYHFPYFGFSYFRYPYYLGYGYPYWPYYGPVWYDYPASDSLGAIDLNVKPKRAEVYLDGQRIGTAGRFDGYPGMLWLEEGTYDLILYLPGYETLHETVKIFTGVVIDFDARLQEGVATRPEDIVPPPEQAGAGREYPEREDADREDADREMDLSHQPARLHLTVEPADASVYLDGRFLGTGAELAELRAGLLVNPGAHQLAVVRPSYDGEELTVEVDAGEDVELAVRLERR